MSTVLNMEFAWGDSHAGLGHGRIESWVATGTGLTWGRVDKCGLRVRVCFTGRSICRYAFLREIFFHVAVGLSH